MDCCASLAMTVITPKEQEKWQYIPEDRIPVIVGIGEIVDRPKEIAARPRATGAAEAGAAPRRSRLRRKAAARDRLARCRELPELALSRSGEAAGAAPRRHARRIAITARSAARARSAICTKRRSASRAANAAWPPSAAPRRSRPRPRPSAPRSTLPWTPFAHDVEEPKRGAAFQKPLAVKLGVFRPITVYPLYESRNVGALGPDPARGARRIRRAVVDLCGRRGRQSQFLAEEAISARRHHDADAGEPADRLALHQADGGQSHREHGRGGAADQSWQRRARPACPKTSSSIRSAAPPPRSRATICCATSSIESHPQNAVLNAVMDLVGGDGKKFDAIELYSCFPCVPKMARRTLGLGPDVQPTVTGGLTFFGAPLNTYMTHAACAMVRKMRERRQARPALRPGRLRHQASRPGAVARSAARGDEAGHQRAGGGRPQQARGAGVRRPRRAARARSRPSP